MEDLDTSSRTYLKKIPELISWLSSKIFGFFHHEEVEAWLIGSIVNGSPEPQDCDVLIILHEKCATRLAQVSSVWKEEFQERFGLPLHLTRITYDEVQFCDTFLQAVFDKCSVQITPNILNAT